MKCQKCGLDAGIDVRVDERRLFELHVELCTRCLNHWTVYADGSADYADYSAAFSECERLKCMWTPGGATKPDWIVACTTHQEAFRAMRTLAVEWLATPLPDAGPTQMQRLEAKVRELLARNLETLSGSYSRGCYDTNHIVLGFVGAIEKAEPEPTRDADIAAGKVESVKTLGQLAGELHTNTAPAEPDPVRAAIGAVWTAINDLQIRVRALTQLPSRVAALEHPAQPHQGDTNTLYGEQGALRSRVGAIEQRMVEIERDNMVESGQAQPEQPNPTSTWIAELQQLVSRVERLEGRASRVLGLEGVVKHLDKRVDALEGGEG